jgi:flagellar biosynthesis protein FlhF
MKLKKYYADNMQEALKIIKEDIGSDAVILSSKFVRTKKGLFGLFSKKQIEVVAGFDEKPKPKPQPAPQQFKPVIKAAEEQEAMAQQLKNMPSVRPAAPVENVEKPEAQDGGKQDGSSKKMEEIDESLIELKKLINGLTDKVEGYKGNDETRFSRDVREIFNALVENDINRELAAELCLKTENVMAARDADPKEVVSIFLQDEIGDIKPIQSTKFKRKVIMLIGPTGVGKTTTLIKLASKFFCEDKQDVGVINADVFRVAAKEHLKAYCDILNMDLITIFSPAEVVDALEAFKNKDIVFIDTAGKLSSNKDYQEEIKDLVKYGDVDDIYLLVSASTSERVIKSIVENYAFLKSHNIIVTKVDEIPTMGAIINIARDSRRPLSYMTTGQNVPDDIVLIDAGDVVRQIMENMS